VTTSASITLPEPLKDWLEERQRAASFSTISQVVQDLIRQAQAAETAALQREFRDLCGKAPAGSETEPVEVVVAAANSVKRRNAHRA
jgi:Arc/MetJ-type ribon-helix-helix transcriptional regulator